MTDEISIGGLPGGGTSGTGGIGSGNNNITPTNTNIPVDTTSPAISDEQLRRSLSNIPELPESFVDVLVVMRNVSDAVREFTEELNNAEITNWEKISGFIQDIIDRADALLKLQNTLINTIDRWNKTTAENSTQVDNEFDVVATIFFAVNDDMSLVPSLDSSAISSLNAALTQYNNLGPGDTVDQALLDSINNQIQAYNTYLINSRPGILSTYEANRDLLDQEINDYNAAVDNYNADIDLINSERQQLRDDLDIDIADLPDLEKIPNMPTIITSGSPTPGETDLVAAQDLQTFPEFTLQDLQDKASPPGQAPPDIDLLDEPVFGDPTYTYDILNIAEPVTAAEEEFNALEVNVVPAELESLIAFLDSFMFSLDRLREFTEADSLTFEQLGKPIIDPSSFIEPEKTPLAGEAAAPGGVALAGVTNANGQSIELAISRSLERTFHQDINANLAVGALAQLFTTSGVKVATVLGDVLGRTVGNAGLTDPILLALIGSATGTELTNTIKNNVTRAIINGTIKNDDPAVQGAATAIANLSALLIPFTQLGLAIGLPNLASQALAAVGALDNAQQVGGIQEEDELRDDLIQKLTKQGIDDAEAIKQTNLAIDKINAEQVAFNALSGPATTDINPQEASDKVIQNLINNDVNLAGNIAQGLSKRGSNLGLPTVGDPTNTFNFLTQNVEGAIIDSIAKKFRTQREFSNQLVRELIRRGFSTSASVIIGVNVAAFGKGLPLLNIAPGSTERNIKIAPADTGIDIPEATDLSGLIAQVGSQLNAITPSEIPSDVGRGIRDQVLTNVFGGTHINNIDLESRNNPLSLLNTNFQDLKTAVREINESNADETNTEAKEIVSTLIDNTRGKQGQGGIETFVESLAGVTKSVVNLASAGEEKGTRENILKNAPV